MYKIAIIQFPGTNCEYEAVRAVKQAGMQPAFFRWNRPASQLKPFDGYVISGGFSYEDRIRSGAIAARDPLLEVIKQEAEKGNPVLGLCNGAQILVESGLIPGFETYSLGVSLACNTRGYLNLWVHIKNEAQPGRCAFNHFANGRYFRLPIAHGEGRFVIPQELLNQLIANHQTVFRYCDEHGNVIDEYPVNPNGSVYSLAGVCNPEGNVLALMPHPERVEAGQVIFQSMKKYLEDGNKQFGASKALDDDIPQVEITTYQKPENSMEFLVDLIITDNEAETLQVALEQLKFGRIKVRRFIHWEVGLDISQDLDRNALTQELIDSGELLNTNKEIPYVDDKGVLLPKSHTILVRYKDDFVGEEKLHTLRHRLGTTGITSVKRGVVWQITCRDKTWAKILESHILFNPYSQSVSFYSDRN